MYDLLKLLEENARLSEEQLAAMLGMTKEAVRAQIAQAERQKIIRGYTAIIDWEQTSREYVTARIEVRVTPKKDRGFEEVAEQIAQLEEVRSLYLMSGSYDLALTVTGKSFKDIASFVAYRLAPIESVLSTSTNFVLRKYKEKGMKTVEEQDQRRVVL